MQELNIARVIAEIKEIQFKPTVKEKSIIKNAYDSFMATDIVVDATDIYKSLAANERPIDIYGDFSCLAPPWDLASIAYENEHGNVVIMNLCTIPMSEGVPTHIRASWESPNAIVWEDVHWMLYFNIWVGGRAKGGKLPLPATGPLCSWQWLIDEDGKPLDYHWIQYLPEYNEKIWEMALVVTLESINFMNCKNVYLEEPPRKKHIRKRIEQYGTRISNITVRSVRQSKKGSESTESEVGTSLHSVRGHFAHYGPKYGTGLLFGKLEGRFFIPQHARGSKDVGQTQQRFKLKP